MRTRIALAAASSVTFMSSTLVMLQGTAGAVPRHSHTGTVLDGARVSAAHLRTAVTAGRAAIGTALPALGATLSAASHPVRLRHERSASRGRHARHVVAMPASAVSPSLAPAPAPAVVPAPVTAASASPAPATFAAASVVPPPTDWTSTATPDWQCIRIRESGDVYNDPTRPSGAYGILDSTWVSMGYGGWPYEASPTVQDEAALTLYHEYGWQPWSSRFACGL